ncbi:MAG: WYL domain-containing protein [Campylobacter sp.]|nr:WYL domain-containing protein [Campylobacter sp.]
MSKDSSVKRVIEIIYDLQKGSVLNLANLADKYSVSERTLRRDLEVIKEIFGDIFVHLGGGNYQSSQKAIFENMLNSSEFFMLKEIIKLSHKSSLEISKNLSKSMQDKILKNLDESPYIFKHKPYEEIFARREVFKILERAITYKKEISFKYTNAGKISHFTIQPYKIMFMEQNFYLAGLQKRPHKHAHVIFRIAMMSEVKFSGKEFKRDQNYLDFLHFINSPWASYSPNFRANLIKIILQIPQEHAKYFRLKKFYPTQEIICENDDGSINVEFSVTNFAEILNIIKQWLPRIKVLAPRKLEGIVKGIARDFYENTHGKLPPQKPNS